MTAKAKRKRTTLTANSFDSLKEKCIADPSSASETVRLAVNLLSENPKHVGEYNVHVCIYVYTLSLIFIDLMF